MFVNVGCLSLKIQELGLWPGLWGFIDSDTVSEALLDDLSKKFALTIESVSHLESFRHRLTHIDYSVRPIKVDVSESICGERSCRQEMDRH